MTSYRHWLMSLVVFLCPHSIQADEPSVHMDRSGNLVYAEDAYGNRILDFSYCGYRGSELPIPSVAARVLVSPSGGDDTQHIQAAIQYVSELPLGDDGFRGAVLLQAGDFQIAGQLRILASGVILKGQGAGEGGTRLRATGQDRRALIRVGSETLGRGNAGRKYAVTAPTINAGTLAFQLASTEGLQAGQRVQIRHASTDAWIAQLQVDHLGWRAGTRDIRWIRTITKIDGSHAHLDAPITLDIDTETSPTTLQPLPSTALLNNVGIEDLALVSDFDATKEHDEEHAWYGIHMQAVQDAWVQRMAFRHFAGGAIVLASDTSRITVADCASFQPISELAGYRRQTFFTLGQQCLFLRCWSEFGLHDFAVGHCAAGPNAFVHCYAHNAQGDSGPRESCAVGTLYDNVRIDGHDLNLMNRDNSPRKTGWSALNSVLWQCQAANVRCEQPPVGSNWAVGIWANPLGNGHLESLSDFVRPLSLYQQQLQDRLGDAAAERIDPLLLKPVGATNPSVEQAEEFTRLSTAPRPQLLDLIRGFWNSKQPGSGPVPSIESLHLAQPTPPAQAARKIQLQNGWIVANQKLLVGKHFTPSWWRGELPPERAALMGRAITRFAPGRHGKGLTDNLEMFAAELKASQSVGYDHHYGLWYERRRDDHLMVRRADGEVIPPFYEQPFARSGQGTAWDGLSRYDLTQFNPWYWKRLRDFTTLGEQAGFVLFHHHYFQHNILEAGAHWADSPWRPTNNVNATEFPEPPPYIGDKRIFFDEAFYDVTNAHHRQLHRGYIRQCLDNSASQSNVIHLTSGEFTGPLSFVQFWIDTIAEWKQETQQQAIVGLSCTKDVQDAILNDPDRAPHVDVIDIRYWTYSEDGSLYAPAGGKHLAPRQHMRQLKPKSTSFASVARSVREYRLKYPDKAVTYYADRYCRAQRDGWAILMGGGSMANTPPLPSELTAAIVRMQPQDALELDDTWWCLADEQREFLIYGNTQGPASKVRLPHGNYEWATVNPKSGQFDSPFANLDGAAIELRRGVATWIRERHSQQ